MADKVTIEIVIDDKKAVSTVKGLKKKVSKDAEIAGDDIGSSLSRGLAAGLKNIGPTLIAAFSFVALNRIISQFAEFEQALIGIQKTTNLSDKELSNFSDTLKELSQRIPVSATELAGLAETAGRFGVRGSKNLELFTETLAKLNVATDLVGEEGAQALVRILGVTGESIDQIGTLGAVITDLGNNFRTSESQIVAVANELARSTSQFKISSSSVIAISTALSDLGARAEGSGTAIGKVFREIEKSLLAGGKSLQDFTRITGLTADELKQKFSVDAAAVFKDFIGGLSRIAKAGGSVTAELQSLGLAQDRTLKVLPPLVSGYDRLVASLDRANIQTLNATALNEEAARAFDSLSSDATRALNSITNLANTLVEIFSPAIRAALRGVTAFTTKFAELFSQKTARQRIEELKVSIGELAGELKKIDESDFNLFGRARGQVALELINSRLELEQLKAALLPPEEDANFLAGINSSLAGVVDAAKINAAEIDKIILSGLGGTLLGFGKITVGAFKSFSKQFSKTINFTKIQSDQLARVIKTRLTSSIVNSIQTIVTAVAAGQNAFAALAGSILNLIGDLAISIGQFVIATGVAKLALEFLPGGATIAAGIGLVAIGTFLKTLGSSSFVGGGGGGVGAVPLPPAVPALPTNGGGGAILPPTEGGGVELEPLVEEDIVAAIGPRTEITLIIQGDVLDSRESGMRIVDLLKETFQTNDISLGGLTA